MHSCIRSPALWLPHIHSHSSVSLVHSFRLLKGCTGCTVCVRVCWEWFCGLVALLLLQRKAFRSQTERHTADWLRNRFTASIYLQPTPAMWFSLHSPTFNLSCLASDRIFFVSWWLLLHLSLQVSVALCIALTSDTCFDLVNFCRLRILWDSFGGCEAQLLSGVSLLSLLIPLSLFLYISYF